MDERGLFEHDASQVRLSYTDVCVLRWCWCWARNGVAETSTGNTTDGEILGHGSEARSTRWNRVTLSRWKLVRKADLLYVGTKNNVQSQDSHV
jgi:hypothetical protein